MLFFSEENILTFSLNFLLLHMARLLCATLYVNRSSLDEDCFTSNL